MAKIYVLVQQMSHKITIIIVSFNAKSIVMSSAADIDRKSPIVTNLTCIWRSRWGDSDGISPGSLAAENYSPWAIVWHCLRDPMFSNFWYSAGLWQTDRQTHDDSIYRASIVSRGKKIDADYRRNTDEDWQAMRKFKCR